VPLAIDPEIADRGNILGGAAVRRMLRRVRRTLVAAALGLTSGAWGSFAVPCASAQDNPFQALAEHLNAPGEARYRGPWRPFPERPRRPAPGLLRAQSVDLPLEVDADASVGAEQVQRALQAAERAYAWLAARGWPLPYPLDGRHGSELVVYLRPGLAAGASAGAEAPIAFTLQDAATTFALLDAALGGEELDRCALSALAQAGLLGHDPAETPAALAAGAALATFLAHGTLGCRPEPERMQRASYLGPLGDDPAQRDAAALWLALEMARHDPNDAGLAAGLYALAEQHSESPNALHGRPDVWQALSSVLHKAGETLDDAAVELAVQRLLLPGGRGAGFDLPPDATVPWSGHATMATLPAAVSPRELLMTYGSAYAQVETTPHAPGAQLRIWLRGDAGVRWSLVAVRLDPQGREVGRVSAPPRRVAQSYLPVELDAETASVALVVTKLPWIPDGRGVQDPDQDAFRLLIDQASPDHAR